MARGMRVVGGAKADKIQDKAIVVGLIAIILGRPTCRNSHGRQVRMDQGDPGTGYIPGLHGLSPP